MNKKQGITLGVGILLIVVIAITYTLIINNIQLSPATNPEGELNLMQSVLVDTKSARLVHSAQSQRNVFLTIIVLGTIITCIKLGDKKKNEKNKQNDLIEDKNEKRDVMKQLVDLKENGIISSEEFYEKVKKLN